MRRDALGRCQAGTEQENPFIVRQKLFPGCAYYALMISPWRTHAAQAKQGLPSLSELQLVKSANLRIPPHQYIAREP